MWFQVKSGEKKARKTSRFKSILIKKDIFDNYLFKIDIVTKKNIIQKVTNSIVFILISFG